MHSPFPLATVNVINLHLQAGVCVLFSLYVCEDQSEFETLRMKIFFGRGRHFGLYMGYGKGWGQASNVDGPALGVRMHASPPKYKSTNVYVTTITQSAARVKGTGQVLLRN